MIERSKHAGHYDAECDKCPAKERLIPAGSFAEALRAIKNLGWTVERNERRNWWEHKCPKCSTGSTSTVEESVPFDYSQYQ